MKGNGNDQYTPIVRQDAAGNMTVTYSTNQVRPVWLDALGALIAAAPDEAILRFDIGKITAIVNPAPNRAKKQRGGRQK